MTIRHLILYIALFTYGAFIVLIQSGQGLRSGDDTIYYSYGAQSLIQGHGIRNQLTLSEREIFLDGPPGAPLTAWAPLYAIVLAGLKLAGITPLIFHAGLNGALSALGVLCIRQYVAVKWIKVAGAMAWLTSPVVLVHGAIMQPESIFVVCVACLLIGIPATLEKPTPIRLANIATISAIACLDRYTGLFIVVIVVGLIVLQARVSLVEKLVTAGVYCWLAVSPLLLWLVRNYYLMGTPFGPRPPAERGNAEPFVRLVVVLSDWATEFLLWIILTLSVLAIVWLWRRSWVRDIVH